MSPDYNTPKQYQGKSLFHELCLILRYKSLSDHNLSFLWAWIAYSSRPIKVQELDCPQQFSQLSLRFEPALPFSVGAGACRLITWRFPTGMINSSFLIATTC